MLLVDEPALRELHFDDNGLLFRSKAETLIYRELKAFAVTLAPLLVFNHGGADYRRLELDFSLIHAGVMMIAEVDGAQFHAETPVVADELLAVLSRDGLHAERFARDCSTEDAARRCARHLVALLEKLKSDL